MALEATHVPGVVGYASGDFVGYANVVFAHLINTFRDKALEELHGKTVIFPPFFRVQFSRA